MDYKKEWEKLKERLIMVSLGFEAGSKLQKGIEFICEKYVSESVKGIIEYMEGVEKENGL